MYSGIDVSKRGLDVANTQGWLASYVNDYEGRDALIIDLDALSVDLVEVAPPYDTNGNTALVGANLLYEMLCVLPGVAHR